VAKHQQSLISEKKRKKKKEKRKRETMYEKNQHRNLHLICAQSESKIIFPQIPVVCSYGDRAWQQILHEDWCVGTREASQNASWKTKFSISVDRTDTKLERMILTIEVYRREPIFLRSCTVKLQEFLDKYARDIRSNKIWFWRKGKLSIKKKKLWKHYRQNGYNYKLHSQVKIVMPTKQKSTLH